MRYKYPSRLKEIHSQVLKLSNSIDNMLEMITLFHESIEVARKINPDIAENTCLKYLLNTKEKYTLLYFFRIRNGSNSNPRRQQA